MNVSMFGFAMIMTIGGVMTETLAKTPIAWTMYGTFAVFGFVASLILKEGGDKPKFIWQK